MKNQSILKTMAFMLLLALVVFGCKKEEDPPEEAQGLSFDSEEVLAKVPAGLKNSSDEYAQNCYDFIESALDMSSFIDNMDVPDDATYVSKKGSTSSSSWQWSWHYGGESFTFYWTYEERSGKRYWTMEVQYGNGPRATYIEAWETLDGTEGEVQYNYNWIAVEYGEPLDEEDLIFWRYTWELDSSGVYHISLVIDDSSGEADFAFRYDVIINDDGSGSIAWYSMGILFYQMTWDAIGNGTWAYYSEGSILMNGSWSVV